MNQSIPRSVIPPRVPGLEKEEPELRNEEDIPRDDPHPGSTDDSMDDEDGPREVERE
jgi:hypothetical protein